MAKKQKTKFHKAELVDGLQKHIGGSRANSERVADFIFDTIIARVQKGEQVSIAGFGSFEKKDYKARVGRNPSNGTPVEVPAMARVRFTPALNFKRSLNTKK